jgi:hypothetical protein
MKPDRSRPVVLSTHIPRYRVQDAELGSRGKVEALMIDVQDGRVSHAVLSFGGFLGLGKQYITIPWRSLNIDPQANRLRVQPADPNSYNASGSQAQIWPERIDREWLLNPHLYHKHPID